MSQPISLFSGYSQKENRVTNYVLLILRMLYEESPGYLSEVFSELLPDDVSNSIGVSFNQQVRKVSSVPDGIISQKAFTIFIEAKNYDWFYDSQLENHLEALDLEAPGNKVLIVLGSFDSDLESRFESIRAKMRESHGDSIHFSAITFESFMEVLNALKLPKNLQDAVSEIEYFFNEQNLLPRWKGVLDVVNCSGSYDEYENYGVYLCPTRGGAYSHKRCRYFGAYKNKEVNLISEIRAVIDVDMNGESSLNWSNVETDNDELMAEATTIAKKLRPGSESVRVFLLGDRYKTNFRKDTKGGMQQSKLYFDISSLNVDGAKALAQIVDGRKWSEIR